MADNVTNTIVVLKFLFLATANHLIHIFMSFLLSYKYYHIKVNIKSLFSISNYNKSLYTKKRKPVRFKTKKNSQQMAILLVILNFIRTNLLVSRLTDVEVSIKSQLHCSNHVQNYSITAVFNFKGLAQGPNCCSLAVSGLKLLTFQSVTQSLNCLSHHFK